MKKKYITPMMDDDGMDLESLLASLSLGVNQNKEGNPAESPSKESYSIWEE